MGIVGRVHAEETPVIPHCSPVRPRQVVQQCPHGNKKGVYLAPSY